MTFTVREPVMAEPLGYQSSKGGIDMMNNISNIDLEYNFNNLRNMIQFNCAQLYAKSSKNYIYDKDSSTSYTVDGIKPNDRLVGIHD